MIGLPAFLIFSENQSQFVACSGYNYLNEDGVPTGIDVELATEAFKRMGYQVEVVQINWEKKKELVESGEIDCIMGCFSMEGRLDEYRWAGPYIASRQVAQQNVTIEFYSPSIVRILKSDGSRY